MNNISHMKEWFLSDPDKLITYVYWLKGLIPKDRDGAKKKLAKQLNDLHPCPEEHRKKWGL